MISLPLVDMAKTPEEIKEESSPQGIPYDPPLYPYGLCLNLDKEQLDRLGLSTDVEVNDGILVAAMAKVTSVSSRELADGSTDCRVELQITHLGVLDSDEEEETEDE